MAKKNNSSLILWTLVSLIIGILLGLLITSLATTGQAKSAIDVAPRTSLNHNANLVLNQKMYDSSEDYRLYEFSINTKVGSTLPVTAKIYDNYNISFNDSENNWIYGNNTEKTMIGTRDVPIISHSNYVQLPYITNNPTVYSYGLAEFYLNNTNSVFKREDVTINPSQFPYPEATNFDFDCQGYGINYTASEVEFIHYEIKLGDGLSEQYSIVALIDNPYSTTSNSGTFSSEVLNYLNDGQNHNVRIDAYLITTQNTGRLITKVSRMKRLNCQTRKSENIKPSKEATAEEIDELNTIIEKLAKK